MTLERDNSYVVAHLDEAHVATTANIVQQWATIFVVLCSDDSGIHFSRLV